MRSRPTIVTMLSLGLLAGAAAPTAPTGHKLECPASAPADWGLTHARLNQVDILSFRPGDTIDEKAPPTLMPDRDSIRSGTLHQVWELNATAGDGEVQQLWCRYSGSDRILKLPEAKLQRCEQTITRYSANGVNPRSQRAAFCD